MFLDDELLEMCRNANCENADDIQKLYANVCKKCENYYKTKLYPNMSKKEAKAVLDRTFNLWDSFVRSAIKEGDIMKILGELFQEHSFKKELFKNEKIAEIYKSL